MGLDFAIDELYASGWDALDTSGCESHGGRWVPSVERARREFEARGLTLSVTHAQLFDCFRAEWADAAGVAAGSVVGQSEAEAVLYALAPLRRAEVSSTV